LEKQKKNVIILKVKKYYKEVKVMERVWNFSAGPAVLPEEVLKIAAEQMLNYENSGMGVMEMSHRSKVYDKIIKDAEADLRKLMNIPNNYKVLFLQGGGHLQFSMVPLNLMKNKVADYIVTGEWAKKAAKEAAKYVKVNKIASSDDKNFTYIPDLSNLKVSPDADYVFICQNNTIYGTRFTELPDTSGKDLVSDMSSNILSEPFDVTKFALIFAGAQKNIGPAGTTIVIIREDLLTDDLPEYCPTMLSYKIHADKDSLYNTPPTYGIYVCGLVFKHLLANGGVEEMYKKNLEKANLLYNFLDNSKLFKGTVAKKDRSLMNVTFVTDSEEINDRFIKEATAAGLVNLKGHRSVGGMRASIYNAMPVEGVKALVKFMDDFERKVLNES
jgi:phosphoserine aminotransferase